MQSIVTPTVSVIVASHRETGIELFVRNWNKSIWGTIPVEVLIVADYPVDAYQNRFPALRWLFVPDRSISRKRNAGIAAARGAICGFIDDDCHPAEGWIVNAVSYLETHPETAGVEGQTTIERVENRTGAYKEFKRLEKPGYRTNNIFYRRDVLVGGFLFDERFTVQREDIDLAFSLLASGHLIGHDMTIRVEHRFRENEKWDLLKNCINRRFDPLLFRKHRKLYRRHIGSPYPPGILVLLCLCIGMAVASYLHHPALVYLLCLYIGVTTILTFRRTNGTHPVSWLREYLSFAISPCVLCGALIYGSIRFRYIFLL